MFAQDCRDKGDGKGKRPVGGGNSTDGFHGLIRALATVRGELDQLPPDFGLSSSTKHSGSGMANLAAVLAKVSKPEPEERMK